MKNPEIPARENLNTEVQNERPGLTVHIVRHGPAAYGELEGKFPGYSSEFSRDQEHAKDLSIHGRGKSEGKTLEEIQEGINEAVALVEKTASEIADTIETDEEVVIWSSGTARTLHTARIIRDELRKRGVTLRERGQDAESQIQVFDHFNDIRNFDYNYFVTLADGGTLNIDGEEVILNKADTNPEGLGYTEYYASGAVHNISESVRQFWPQKLQDSVSAMESFEDMSARVLERLKRVSKVGDKKYRLIIVSHGSAADQLIRTYKPEALTGMSPAEYVTVTREGEKMVVTHAGDFEDGDTKTDIFQKFEVDKLSGKFKLESET